MKNCKICFCLFFILTVFPLFADTMLDGSVSIQILHTDGKNQIQPVSISPESTVFNYKHIFTTKNKIEFGLGGGLGMVSMGCAFYANSIAGLNIFNNSKVFLQLVGNLKAGIIIPPISFKTCFFYYETGIGIQCSRFCKKGLVGALSVNFSQFISENILISSASCSTSLGWRF